MPSLASNIRHLWRVWLSSARASVTREMAFRANFIIGAIRQALWLAVFIFFIEIIFMNTDSLVGWSKSEALLILALSRLIEGLINTLFANNITTQFVASVNDGKFDFYLTKPIPTQFYAAFRYLTWTQIGNIFAGIALLIYVIPQITPSIPLTAWLLFLALAIMGIVVYYSLIMMAASLAFVLERYNALWAFSLLFSEPLTYPFEIFPTGPRIALTYLLPLAFIVYVPAQALTGRLALWQLPIALTITAFFLILANLAWSTGLRRYSSASS